METRDNGGKYKKRRTIASKIILASLLSIIIAVAVVTTIALIPFTKISKEAVRFQSELGVKSLQATIATQLSDAEGMAVTLAYSGRTMEIFEKKDSLTHQQLRDLAATAVREAGRGDAHRVADLLVLSDRDGTVIVRYHDDKAGDNVAEVRETFRDALAGRTTSAIERGALIAWTASAAAPVHDRQGNIIGAVGIGYDMTNPALVDRIKEMIGADVTIFRGDERINTTIIKPDGSRAVGTKLDPAIADRLLREGKDYEGKADILGIPYITLYSPIRDKAGEIIGIYFSGGNLKMVLSSLRSTLVRAIGASLFLALLCGVVLYLLIRKIVSPLKRLVPVIERLEAGDFSMSEEELTVRSNDEIGHVAELIGRMTHSIRDAIGSAVSVGRQTAEKAELLAGLAKHTREAAIRIADDSLALSDMSSDNAAALEEANASVEEIASGAALGAKGATEGAESAQIVVDKANESSALAKKTAESIESIGKESKKTMEAVKGMETAVGSITSFVGTITSIADQTNLLALNAAIEAARAGEAGRGFAVVAEEVRKLAEESNVAAQEVRNFVEALGTHASATHSSMAQVDRIVMKTTEEAKTTSERLAEALTEVEKISEVLQSIAAATEEQAAASSEAAMGIDSVAQGVEKEASTMHEVTSTAEEAKADAEKVFSEAGLMLEIARSLEEDLRRFTL